MALFCFDSRRNSANSDAGSALEHCNLRHRPGSSRCSSSAEGRKSSISNAGRKHNEFVSGHRVDPCVDSSFCQSAASANATLIGIDPTRRFFLSPSKASSNRRGEESGKAAGARIGPRALLVKLGCIAAAPKRHLSPRSQPGVRSRNARWPFATEPYPPLLIRERFTCAWGTKKQPDAAAPIECLASGASRLALHAWRSNGVTARADERRQTARSLR
jgi:hypothetical protein